MSTFAYHPRSCLRKNTNFGAGNDCVNKSDKVIIPDVML
jgi:hypothetical protein